MIKVSTHRKSSMKIDLCEMKMKQINPLADQ